MLSQLLLVNYNLPLSFFMIMLIPQIRLELTLPWDCMQSALKDICPDKKLVKKYSVSGWVTNRFRNSDFLLSVQGHRTWNDQVKSNSRHHHGKLIKILISQCLKPPLHQFPWQWHSHWKHYVKKSWTCKKHSSSFHLTAHKIGMKTPLQFDLSDAAVTLKLGQLH